jgi:hypothetical protein
LKFVSWQEGETAKQQPSTIGDEAKGNKIEAKT